MNFHIPKVSVVIPCYNDKYYIQETVQSILRQTFQDFEIIVVDDGSNEETKEILRSFNNKKIQILTQINQGVSNARNNGISKSKAEYILVLDGDDIVNEVFLDKAVAILDYDNNKKVGAVSSYCNIFEKKDTIIHKHTPIGGGVNNFLFDNNCVSFALIRKECWKSIGGYDEEMKNGFEDWEFWIAMTKRGWDIFMIPDFLFSYRQKKAKISLDKASKIYYREENLKYIFIKHQDLYQNNFTDAINYLTDLAARNKKNEIKYKNSLEFRIGDLALKPFRFIKQYLKFANKL